MEIEDLKVGDIRRFTHAVPRKPDVGVVLGINDGWVTLLPIGNNLSDTPYNFHLSNVTEITAVRLPKDVRATAERYIKLHKEQMQRLKKIEKLESDKQKTSTELRAMEKELHNRFKGGSLSEASFKSIFQDNLSYMTQRLLNNRNYEIVVSYQRKPRTPKVRVQVSFVSSTIIREEVRPGDYSFIGENSKGLVINRLNSDYTKCLNACLSKCLKLKSHTGDKEAQYPKESAILDITPEGQLVFRHLMDFTFNCKPTAETAKFYAHGIMPA